MIAALNAADRVVLHQASVVWAAATDPVYHLLVNRVRVKEWPASRLQEMSSLKPFYNMKECLATDGELVMYTYEQSCVQLMMPESLWHQVAANFHAGHQEVELMCRAWQAMYWPGLEVDLLYHCSSCGTCERCAPSQHQEPFIPTPPPDYLFQQVVVDLFLLDGGMYMAYADRLTG